MGINEIESETYQIQCERGTDEQKLTQYLGKEWGYIIYLIMNYLFDMYWWQITR